MSHKSRQRGKQTELAVAKMWGMKRAHFQAADTYGHELVTIEVKCRQSPIKTIEGWLTQAEKAAHPGTAGIVQFHTLGRAYKDDIVIMRASDALRLIGKQEEAE